LSDLKVKFKDLALGAKFSYKSGSKQWVKISAVAIAEWDESLKTSRWMGQSICTFEENNDTTKFVYVL